MKRSFRLITMIALACSAVAAHAALIFDDLPTFTNLTEEYAGFGVHSDGASQVQGGIGNGDPGNWELEGTNGSKFLGNNGGANYTTSLLFDSGLSWIDFDISRSLGSAAGDTWQARIYDASDVLIGSQSGDFNPVNSWTNVAFNIGGIRRLEIQSFGSDFRPYGIDDVNLAPVPEPATLLVVGGGLAAFLRRRRSRT